MSQRSQDTFFDELNTEFLQLSPVSGDQIEQHKGQQLKMWMRYRDSTCGRAVGTGDGGSQCRGKVSLFEGLILPKTTRPLHAMEVYQKMYGLTVRAEVKKRAADTKEKTAKEKFLAGLATVCELKDAGEKDKESQDAKTDKHRWAMSLWWRVVTSMYDREKAVVKAAVRERMAVLNMARSLRMQDASPSSQNPNSSNHSAPSWMPQDDSNNEIPVHIAPLYLYYYFFSLSLPPYLSSITYNTHSLIRIHLILETTYCALYQTTTQSYTSRTYTT
ncbi:hypothetical protein K438DRAFT_1968036 [Mycena galopus ATCC 62051]|nr:hypothetical protein K438DRAFT_1968036 [Mycena galopus ATCC 62051]